MAALPGLATVGKAAPPMSWNREDHKLSPGLRCDQGDADAGYEWVQGALLGIPATASARRALRGPAIWQSAFEW